MWVQLGVVFKLRSFFFFLGVLYHRWKKYSLAEAAYKYALTLKPDMKSAQDNLRLLYKTLNRV